MTSQTSQLQLKDPKFNKAEKRKSLRVESSSRPCFRAGSSYLLSSLRDTRARNLSRTRVAGSTGSSEVRGPHSEKETTTETAAAARR